MYESIFSSRGDLRALFRLRLRLLRDTRISVQGPSKATLPYSFLLKWARSTIPHLVRWGEVSVLYFVRHAQPAELPREIN